MFMLRTSRIYFHHSLFFTLSHSYAAISPSLKAQNVDIEEVMSFRKKKPIKISGSYFDQLPPTFLLSHSKHGKALLIK